MPWTSRASASPHGSSSSVKVAQRGGRRARGQPSRSPASSRHPAQQDEAHALAPRVAEPPAGCEQVVRHVLGLADAALLPEAVAEDARSTTPRPRRSSAADSSRAASQMWARAAAWSPSRNSHHARHCRVMPRGRPVTSSSSWARRSFGQRRPRPTGHELGPAVGADRAGLAGQVTGRLPRPPARVEAVLGRGRCRRAGGPRRRGRCGPRPARRAGASGSRRRRRRARAPGLDAGDAGR